MNHENNTYKPVTIPVTHLCNSNCIFCSNNREWKGTDTKEIIEKLNKHKNARIITLTGGEPTLKKDIFQILDYIKEVNKEASIFFLTNGRRLFYKKFAEQFRPYENLIFEIPLHATDTANHDAITQSKKSFIQTTQGIKNLINLNKNITIRVVITRQNYRELPDISKYIKEELKGITSVSFIYPIFWGKASENSEKIHITLSKISSYLKESMHYLQKNAINLNLLHIPLCLLERRYWKYVEMHVYRKICYECYDCAVSSYCPGIFNEYKEKYGIEELRPIR
jgi:His-Xaa-Ser system radical SAM maturase HxsC